jgi:hypothetical protein
VIVKFVEGDRGPVGRLLPSGKIVLPPRGTALGIYSCRLEHKDRYCLARDLQPLREEEVASMPVLIGGGHRWVLTGDPAYQEYDRAMRSVQEGVKKQRAAEDEHRRKEREVHAAAKPLETQREEILADTATPEIERARALGEVEGKLSALWSTVERVSYSAEEKADTGWQQSHRYRGWQDPAACREAYASAFLAELRK